MAEKRKFEDLLDPDYPQNAKLSKATVGQSQLLSRDERVSRIRAIVKREFQQELTNKEHEIMEIDNRIQLARKLLHRVRYAVVSNYYSKKGMELPDQEAQACVDSLNLKCTAPPVNEQGQRSIHPSLKSILGKQTVDYDEILKARPTREAAKTAKTSIKEKLRTKKEEKRLQRAMSGAINTVICHDVPPKVPRHVEPNKADREIPQLNAARGRNQTKCLIAVGNTSKYVGDEKFARGVTHKWLVYVKTKTPIPIEKILTKVRFFLHPSYRPNDIVDVCEPPYQLSRRGWGEFPIRLQLFFESSLQQKPVQLVHNLVLDKSLTGLQTMGAETLVEMWLRGDHIQESTSKLKTENSTSTADIQSIEDDTSENIMDPPIDHIDDKLMELLNRIENQTSKSICVEDEKIEPTISVPTNIVASAFSADLNGDIHSNRNGFDLEMNLIGNLSTVAVEKDNEFVRSTDYVAQPCAGHANMSSNSLGGNIGHCSTDVNESVIPTVPPSNEANETQNNHKVTKFNPQIVSEISSTDRVPSKSLHSNETNMNHVMSSCTTNPRPINIITRVTSNINALRQPVGKEIVKLQPNSTSIPSTTKKPEIYQKRTVKCIDKQGNIKFLEMYVKAPDSQNDQKGRVVLTSSSTGMLQKAVFVSNGQLQKGLSKPVVIKIAPSTPSNSPKPPSAAVDQNPSSTSTKESSVTKIVSSIGSTSQQSPGLKILSTKENQSNLSSAKPALNSTNKNQILVKNGKMYIIDPLQAKIKQQTKKQESLLKPQVSLLKPVIKNDNLINCIRNDARSVFNHTSIATDHDYTTLMGKSPTPNRVTIHRSNSTQQDALQHHALLHKQKTSIVTVNSPNNSRINVIVTKLDDDDDDDDEEDVRDSTVQRGETKAPMKGSGVTQKSTALMQKPRHDYRTELEDAFIKTNPICVRQAVEFLLKRLPLVNAKASSIDYSLSFPFVVKSQCVFDRLMTPKLKANEWLRAKYILQLLEKHPRIDQLKLWTTKEIILFARLHAYTPVIEYKIGKELGDGDEAIDSTLKDLVKKEIKREKYDIQTITLCHDTCNWISDIRQKINREILLSDEIVDVDGSDDDKDNVLNQSRHGQSPEKNMSGTYFHPLDANLEMEASLVSDTCQDIGIRLRPEEIIKNVLHPSSQMVLVQALRSFLDDLLHRAAACRPDVHVSSQFLDNVIRPEDVKSAILSRPQWDFLTNDGLGVAKPKDSDN